MTLNPTPPASARIRLRARWARRRLRYWTARQLRRLEHRLDPLPRPAERARAAGHPSVVPDTPPSIASGRADLQLVHGNRWRSRPDLPPIPTTVRGGIRYGQGARQPWHRGQAYTSPDRPTGPLPIVTNRCHDTEHQGEA